MMDQSWQACVDAFLQTKQSESIRVTYRSIINTFWHDLGEVDPGAVTDADISTFLSSPSHADHTRGQAVTSVSTYRRRVGTLSALYRFAQTFLIEGKPLYQRPLPAILANWQFRPAAQSVIPAEPFAHFDEPWRFATEQFLRQLWERSGSDDTLESYRTVLRRFFAAPRTPELATRSDVLLFLAQKSEGKRAHGKPVAVATRNNRLCVLRSFYAFASNWLIPGLAPEQFLWQGIPPTQGINYGKPGENPRALTEDELNAFFQAIDTSTVIGKRDYSLFIAFFTLARRRSELYALTWGQIQEAMIVEPNGQRHPGRTYSFFGKGHKRSEDLQEMPAYVYEPIVDYLKAAGRLDAMTDDSYIWTAIHPGMGSSRAAGTNRPLNHHYVNGRMHVILERAGIQAREGLSLHSFRHSSALHRYSLGEDILSLKRLLRHASIGTTDKYLRQLSGTADPGAAALERKFAFLR
jgi:integrase